MECNRGAGVEILSIGLTSTASVVSKDRFEISGTVGGTMVLEAEGVVPCESTGVEGWYTIESLSRTDNCVSLMKSSSDSMSETSSINGCMDDSSAVCITQETHFGIPTCVLLFILESVVLSESNSVTLSDKLDIVCFKSLTSLCMWVVFSATHLQYMHDHTYVKQSLSSPVHRV